MKKYIARGLVYGNCWGGGRVAYASEIVRSSTLAGLLGTAKKMLKDGSLDSGMGYESLIGAALNVEEIEMIQKNGKEFQRSEYSIEIIGNLKKEEQDFLIEN